MLMIMMMMMLNPSMFKIVYMYRDTNALKYWYWKPKLD